MTRTEPAMAITPMASRSPAMSDPQGHLRHGVLVHTVPAQRHHGCRREREQQADLREAQAPVELETSVLDHIFSSPDVTPEATPERT